MYGEIVFYTHGSTIEYGGEIFPAGELTADILNFAPEEMCIRDSRCTVERSICNSLAIKDLLDTPGCSRR